MTPTEFVNRLANHYGFPEVGDPKGLVADYVAALDGTDADLLKAASDRLIRTHQFRNWPTVAECRTAIDRAASDRLNAQRRFGTPVEPVRRVPTPEERARVQALVDGLKAKLTGRVA